MALVVIAAAFFVFTRGGGADTPTDEPEAMGTLDLSLGSGEALASCLAFSEEILAEMPVALLGTARSTADETVVLDVDRWFVGGEAATVTLHAEAGMEALIGGIAFADGTQYLVTATDGNVNYCGYTAEATPDLLASFESAFAG
jgi:hypothetical protein